MQSKTHWEKIYATKSSTDVSWYQPHAMLSLGLIQRIGVGSDAAIIDVDGGASTLTDDLIAHGYRNLSVLDLSGEAACRGPQTARAKIRPRAVDRG